VLHILNFVDVAHIFFFLIFEIMKLQKLLWFKKNLFRDVTLSRNGPGWDAGHFVPFRDCPGQSGTSGHPRFNTTPIGSPMYRSSLAFVCSRVYYCNSLFIGFLKARLSPFQTVLNASVRLIVRLLSFSHISSFMTQQPHWIPFTIGTALSAVLLLNTFPISASSIRPLDPLFPMP